MTEQQTRLTAEELREIAESPKVVNVGALEGVADELYRLGYEGSYDEVSCARDEIEQYRTDIPRLLAHIAALEAHIELLSAITAHDIECAVTKRMVRLEEENPFDARVRELGKLLGFILCGDEYE